MDTDGWMHINAKPSHVPLFRLFMEYGTETTLIVIHRHQRQATQTVLLQSHHLDDNDISKFQSHDNYRIESSIN
jgi:hypothetical protein